MAKKATTTRRAGRPKRSERAIGPKQLDTIASMYLQHATISEIAAALKVAHSTVRHHLDTHVKPTWAAEARKDLHAELARVALIEKTAWERFHASQKPQTKRQIRKELADAGGDEKIIEKILTRTTRTGEVAWIQVVQWCLEFRARIFGHFAPSKYQVESAGEFRVAGATATEITEQMLARLQERMEERRRYDEVRRAMERDRSN
jgi:DNA-binding transcriptional ArsR family regulator